MEQVQILNKHINTAWEHGDWQELVRLGFPTMAIDLVVHTTGVNLEDATYIVKQFKHHLCEANIG